MTPRVKMEVMLSALTYHPTRLFQEKRRQVEIMQESRQQVEAAQSGQTSGDPPASEAKVHAHESRDFRYIDLRRQQEHLSHEFGTELGLLVNLVA